MYMLVVRVLVLAMVPASACHASAQRLQTPSLTPGASWLWASGAVLLLVITAAGHLRRVAHLKQRELAVRQILDHAPDIIIQFDPALRIRYVNPVVKDVIGRPPSALVGHAVGEIGFPGDNVRIWEATLAQVISTGRPNALEFALDTAMGLRHFESRFVPETATNGAVRSVIGITRDVTERRRAEDAHRRNEVFLAEGQRISHAGSWSRNRETGALTWSDEHYRLFGLNPAVAREWPTEKLRAAFWERIHLADREIVRWTFEAVVRESITLVVDFRIVLPDGTLRYVRGEGGPGRDDDFIGTTIDITDVRRAQEELRRSEAYLAEGQRLSRTGSWAWNLASDEIYFSREMLRIYGFEAADRPPPYDVILMRAHPDDAPEVDRAVKEAFRTGTELRLLTRICVPGERMKWVQTFGHPVRDEHGVVLEFIGTVVDVTERRRANRRLRRLMKARYAAVLAERTRIAREMHDGLLQDVSGIALQLGALLPHTAIVPDISERLERILAQAERAGRDARVALQGMRDRAQLGDLVNAVQLAAHLVAGTSLMITVRVSGTPRLVLLRVCDAAASIVHEAVTNAYNHAEARSVTVSVAFAARRIRISVRDDGRGFSLGDDDASGAPHFGLTGMRERAAGIGGALAVSSTPGRGTVVKLDVRDGG
jgi:PAS domain S-box-containing protein